MNTTKKHKPKNRLNGREKYSDALKIAVARDYLTGNFSYGFLKEKYQLRSSNTARDCVVWFLKNFKDSSACVSEQPQANEHPLSHLEKQLQDAQLKIDALEVMISKAEKEFNIDIRKKAGTKQSKK